MDCGSLQVSFWYLMLLGKQLTTKLWYVMVSRRDGAHEIIIIVACPKIFTQFDYYCLLHLCVPRKRGESSIFPEFCKKCKFMTCWKNFSSEGCTNTCSYCALWVVVWLLDLPCLLKPSAGCLGETSEGSASILCMSVPELLVSPL